MPFVGEKLRAYRAAYYAKHHKRIRKATNARRRKHLSDHVEYSRKWVNKNKHKRRAWERAHPERRIVSNHKRRAREAGNGGSFSLRQWFALCSVYNHRCLCCGKIKKLTADHVVPVSKGGSSNISNIQPLCKSCNSSKGTKTTDYRK